MTRIASIDIDLDVSDPPPDVVRRLGAPPPGRELPHRAAIAGRQPGQQIIVASTRL